MTICKFFPPKQDEFFPHSHPRLAHLFGKILTSFLIFKNKKRVVFCLKAVNWKRAPLDWNHGFGQNPCNRPDSAASFGHDMIKFGNRDHFLPFLSLMGPKTMQRWWIWGCFPKIITVTRNHFLLPMDPMDPWSNFFTIFTWFWLSWISLIDIILPWFRKLAHRGLRNEENIGIFRLKNARSCV